MHLPNGQPVASREETKHPQKWIRIATPLALLAGIAGVELASDGKGPIHQASSAARVHYRNLFEDFTDTRHRWIARLAHRAVEVMEGAEFLSQEQKDRFAERIAANDDSAELMKILADMESAASQFFGAEYKRVLGRGVDSDKDAMYCHAVKEAIHKRHPQITQLYFLHDAARGFDYAGPHAKDSPFRRSLGEAIRECEEALER